MGRPPPMNVSNDGTPDEVSRRVPVELSRVPDGRRTLLLADGTVVVVVVVVAETFFLNDIDIEKSNPPDEKSDLWAADCVDFRGIGW